MKLLRFFNIFFSICIWLWFGFSLSVAQSLQLSTSTTETTLQQPISVTLVIDGVTTAGNINVAGIEQFAVRWQSQSTSMQVINGVSRTQVQLALQLEPTTTGTFVLWPAILWNGTGGIQSNTVTITVRDLPKEVAPENQNTWVNNPSDSINWVWYLFAWIIVIVFLFIRKRKLYTKENLSKQAPLQSSNDMFTIPLVTDDDFWDAMDRWWRMKLSQRLICDVSHATLEELRPLIISLPMCQQEIFITALTVIQKVKYAQAVVNPQELIDLAHRLEQEKM